MDEQVSISDAEYVESLENLLIFMCGCYQMNHDKFFRMLLDKENEAYMKFSTVQGTMQRMGVQRLSEMDFKQPGHGFYKIFQEMARRRNLCPNCGKQALEDHTCPRCGYKEDE